jgi:uncharacterized protein YecE (DUF72 family)
METTGHFRSGTSGLVLTEPNKKSYPPEFRDKSRLEYYASQFNSIEINSSFYVIPRGKTYGNWANQVPDDFQFTVKLWKGITHEKEYQEKDLETFMNAIDCLGEKKGCLLIQFPAKTTMDIGRLEKLLASIEKYDQNGAWRKAVEFRHSQWYFKDVYAVLDYFKASLVLHDMPASAPSLINSKANFIYLRFHGEKGDYRGSYDDSSINKTAHDAQFWLNQGKDVYAYFNNTIGNAVGNLISLNKMIRQR